MTHVGGRQTGNRGEPEHRTEQRSGNAFGPQGAALLGELRRIKSVVGGGDGRRFHHRPVDPPPRVEPKLSVRPDEVQVARPSTRRSVEPIAAESITNIRELRIVQLRPSQAGAGADFLRQHPAEPVAGDGGKDARDDRARARQASMQRAMRACRERCGSICRFFLARDAASVAAEGHDLAGRLRRGFQNELRAGLRVLVLGVGLVGGWAVVVPLSAAVTVAGTLVVESNVKKVQHPTGGVVAQILVHDGAHVKEGELLVRLDEVQARANLQVITKQLDEVQVRIARLIAERDGADAPALPRELAARTDDQDVQELLRSENALFNARANARENQKELLHGHVGQLNQEIAGLEAQIKSKGTQLDLISRELLGIQTLYDKQLVPLTRLTSLQREAARLQGERDQLVYAIAETRSKISEAELQIIRIDQDVRAEVTKELRESQDKETELAERSIAARDLVNRIELHAPTSGIVHQLAVHTIGGVIAAGEVVMEIVPDDDDLQIQARLPPKDIDQVRMGQKTLVRMSAFNQRTTPQLNGVVSYISADLSQDKQTDAAYYTVRVTLAGDELRRLGGLQLVSGMPAEVFLQTGSRTMMSYLLKPITDQLQRTFSER